LNRAPIFGVLAAVLIGFAFFFFLYSPASDRQGELRAEADALTSQAQTLRSQIAALEQIRSREPEIRAQLARLQQLIPDGPAQPTAIRELQISADLAGVEMTSVTFGTPIIVEGAPPTGTPGTALASVPVSVVIEGGYFQAVDFFRRLEVDVPRAVLFQSLSAAASPDQFPELASTITGQLFSVVPVTAETPAAAPTPGPSAAPSPAASPAPAGEGTGTPPQPTATPTTTDI